MIKTSFVIFPILKLMISGTKKETVIITPFNMLTYEYKPNVKKIEERKNIPIFGETALSFTGKTCSSKLAAPKFHRQDEPQEKSDVYHYIPTFKPKSEYLHTKDMPFTLHVFNIPCDLSKKAFLDLICNKLDDPIFHCNMVHDKERRQFIGVAYLKFDNEEKGRKAMKALDGMQIGDLLLGVNVAKRQF